MVILEDAQKILSYGEICDHCLGRFFGKRSFGLTNEERGRALRIALSLEDNTPYQSPGPCWICGDLFSQVEVWADRVIAATGGTEFERFVIGTRVPPLMAESEEIVWSDLSLTHAEPLKSEMNREVGKAVARKTGRIADPKQPEVVAILNLPEECVEVQINPIFFYGRYRKLERGIPQTHWHCRACQGQGCEACNFTGKQYLDSVEELIGRPVMRLFLAENAILHGSGREDIDALMVGTGRPFVMEVVAPRVRNPDLHTIEEAVNREAGGRVSVTLERWSSRDEVEIIKSTKGYKKYRILVEIDGPYSYEELQSAIRALKGAKINQRTPLRVAHRRADRVRERRVLDIGIAGEADARVILEVTGEAGLYIKELVSGDQGRTEPSLSGLLGRSARVCSLDVVQVQGHNEGE
ncbi:MAG TPA: tRNA pseudouridine(54/55) synthase Pus10 [Methanolinea sp.]|jgi:tRNA pseudouridine synthase 10|nr:tRNA pseudouridine(54/55) synthase Pus10 [Methanolinea sp.]